MEKRTYDIAKLRETDPDLAAYIEANGTPEGRRIQEHLDNHLISDSSKFARKQNNTPGNTDSGGKVDTSGGHLSSLGPAYDRQQYTSDHQEE